VARHGGIQGEQSIEILRGADLSCAVEEHTGNSIVRGHVLAAD
jgi:hypothetical protein